MPRPALGEEIREERILGLVEDHGGIEPRAQPVGERRLADADGALDGEVAKVERCAQERCPQYTRPRPRSSALMYAPGMAWFKKVRKPIEAPADKSRVPEGLWVKCPSCAQIIYNKDLAASLSVCTKCSHHFRLNAAERLRSLFDGSWQEFDPGLTSRDPLSFTDTKPYRTRLEASIASTGLKDAVVTAVGQINGITTSVAAMEYGFIGGSMGVVVGEKITRAIERAIAGRMPVIIVSCSGGARMMEGALSLMQMAKISAALARLDRARLPYVSILTDPTTGGVTASFAMLGDVNIAEPKALIGFAGPRVIEQTIRQKLPEGFQRSEFLLERGMLDMVVDRRELKDVLTRFLRFGGAGLRAAAPPLAAAARPTPDVPA
jgi:acetyl-CoA carboxylase carboxyl transferase subunit beta